MGLFLAPVLLAMVIGFSISGLRSAFRVLVEARQRVTAAVVMLAITAGLSALAIVLPFAVMATKRVPAFGFLFSVLYIVAGAATAGGMLTWERYREPGRATFGLFSAACYLSAAGFPFTWFWLSERMDTLFRVTWSY